MNCLIVARKNHHEKLWILYRFLSSSRSLSSSSYRITTPAATATDAKKSALLGSARSNGIRSIDRGVVVADKNINQLIQYVPIRNIASSCANHGPRRGVLGCISSCSVMNISNHRQHQLSSLTSNADSNNNTIPFLLADIGEGIKEVELIQWFVAIGDTIQQFDKICLVQSDKATVEITSRYDGTIVSLDDKVPGDMIQVGQPLLYLSTDNVDQVNTTYGTDHSVDRDDSNDHTNTSKKSSSTSISDMIHSASHTKTNILDEALLKERQESLEENELSYPTDDDSDGDSHDDIEPHSTDVHYIDDRMKAMSEQKFAASPAVRRLAKEYNLTNNDISSMHGTGPSGRILKSDLVAYLRERELLKNDDNNKQQQQKRLHEARSKQPIGSSALSSPSPINQQQHGKSSNLDVLAEKDNDDKIITLKGYNRLMYKAMTESLKVPQMGFADEIIMNNIQKFRNEINANEDGDKKISMLPFLIKACSLALTEYPIINSIVHNDDKMELCIRSSHNIGIAVQTARGLVVPVIKNCNNISIYEIQSELNRLKYSASNSLLSEYDLSDATISLSNIGSMGGGTYMNPMVVPPTTTIGAFGKIQTLPRFCPSDNNGTPSTTSSLENESSNYNNVYPANIMYVSWAADHRYLDGATLCLFSSCFKKYIENPYKMFAKLQ